MTDINHAPVCGLYCASCHFFGDACQGCGYVGGKPFWAEQMPGGICPLFNCCVNSRRLEHCGLCADFPCSIFLELRDPNMSDEEFNASLAARQKNLARRAQVGTDQWLLEITEA